ncbi:phosphotransferase enzyme family protein [Brachybacterium timonense]|uniref:phosphotransferase enzyme family protein n=1 Tax=Brachybacterium timonense TaxID=2050896 RepID=UPI0014828982|nr:aminoglycoside phosphotransferase family protein [Brachybacterium timonense]
MQLHSHPALSSRQKRFLERQLPGAEVVADLGWGGQYATVLEVVHEGRRLVVKATSPSDHHALREIAAHCRWVGALAATGDAAQAVLLDAETHVLVFEHLPGRIVLEHPAQDDPHTYEQAGVLLARLHAVEAIPDGGTYWPGQREKIRQLLERPHRIPTAQVRVVRAEVDAWGPMPTTLVPTHGDYQPRNWLVDDSGRVRLIDFGRAELRPAVTDIGRLSRQDFLRDAVLEQAFWTGYGTDLRGHEMRRAQIVEAIGTAVWAFGVGDEDFEAHGLRLVEMVARGA